MDLGKRPDREPVYNEPSKSFGRDLVPRFGAVAGARLEPFARARVELEQRMFVCGVEPRPDALPLTDTHFRVLVEMLKEIDSPLSVRLRAQAAAWVGNYQVREALPTLREIVLDEDDDPQTRLNAIPSFVEMAGDEAYGVIERVLASADATTRAATYRAALRNRGSRIAALALERLERGEDRSVYAAVMRRTPVLQERHSTIEAPRTPSPPRQDLKGCSRILFGHRLMRGVGRRGREGG